MTTLRRIFAKITPFFSGTKGNWRLVALTALSLFAFAAPNMARAGECGLGDPGSCVAMMFVKVFQLLTALMGYILILEVDALIRVAQYYNFVSPGPTAVRIGWVVTRDLANMFFIVFLLIIAFSTVIGYAKYHYEKSLKTLLIMAVVINFSKTLVGLMIDVSQVVMLSFVNGFRSAAAGNFMNAFQISKLLSLADGASGYDFGLVLAMMLAFILAAIAVSVVLVMLVMMVFRIIMLWVLIILSPIAFLGKAFEGGGSYYAQWWGELKKYLIGGPVIAFFLWLALATAQQTGGNLSSASEGWGAQSLASSQEVQGQAGRLGISSNSQIPSEAGRTDTILSMVIAICIMFAGLKFASDPSIGGMGAGFAGKVRGKVQNTLKSAVTTPVGFAYGAASNRVKQGAYGVAGTLATRIPGLNRITGGIGAVALAREEEIKKKRRASLEKFTGTEEQKARFMTGSSYAARVAGFSDPKRQMEAFKLAMANPKTRDELFKPGKDGAYSQAALALKNINANGSAKEVMEMADLAASDKVFNKALKGDPELLASTRARMQEIAEKDPNQKKKADEFDQKFVAQLANAPMRDKSGALVYEKGKDGELVLDAAGKPIEKQHFTDEALGKMVPKMSLDDIGGLDHVGVGLLAKHMSDAQFNKAREGAATDAKKKEALKIATEENLQNIRKSGGDDNKIAAAAIRSISVGSLTADEIKNDSALQGALGRGMDTAALARNVDKDDAGQIAASKEAFRAIMAVDPVKLRNLSRNDAYNKLLPDKAEIDAAANQVVTQQKAAETQKKTNEKNVEREELARQAPDMIVNLQAQLNAMKGEIDADKAAGRPVTAKEDQQKEIADNLKKLNEATEKRIGAEKELAQMSQRLAEAQKSGAEGAAALQGAVERLKKGVQDMDSNLAKQVAALKGRKFDEGGGNRNKSRGGGTV